MSHVGPALKRSLRLAVDTPKHLLLAGVTGLLGAVLGLALGFVPLVGPLASNLLVTPALLVILLGSAEAVRDGGSVTGGARAALSDHFASMVGAYGLLLAGYVVVGLVVAVLTVVGAFVLGFGTQVPGGGVGGVGLGVALLVALLGLVVALLVLLVAVVYQFVGPAIVVGDADAVEGVKTAWRVVRRNPLTVAGFTLVTFGLVLAFYAVPVGLGALGAYAASERIGLALGGVGLLVAMPLLGAVASLYQVLFFDSVAGEQELPETIGGDGAVDGHEASATKTAREMSEEAKAGESTGDGSETGTGSEAGTETGSFTFGGAETGASTEGGDRESE